MPVRSHEGSAIQQGGGSSFLHMAIAMQQGGGSSFLHMAIAMQMERAHWAQRIQWSAECLPNTGSLHGSILNGLVGLWRLHVVGR